MKKLAKILMLALSVTLVCASMFLVALASEDVHQLFESDGHTLSHSPAEDAARYRTEPYPGREYGTRLNPDGLDLGFGASNAPALHGEARIPRLEDGPESTHATEGVLPMGEPETSFIPAPNTGYAGSRNLLLAAAVLLGSALALSLKKPCREI